MTPVIVVGNYGAIATMDTSALSGYYILSLMSNGYVLQKGIKTNSEKIPEGELVCDITWLNPLPNCSKLYSHGYRDDSTLNSTIRIQHDVDEENVTFQLLSSSDELPKTLRSMFPT